MPPKRMVARRPSGFAPIARSSPALRPDRSSSQPEPEGVDLKGTLGVPLVMEQRHPP